MVTIDTKEVTKNHTINHLRHHSKSTPGLTVHPVRSSGSPPSTSPDSYGTELKVSPYVTEVTVTRVNSVKNPKVHQTSQPSPPNPYTCTRTREPVTYTTPVTVVVTILLDDLGIVRYDHHRHLYYPTHPVRGVGIHRVHSPAVYTIIVVKSSWDGVWDPPHDSTVITT